MYSKVIVFLCISVISQLYTMEPEPTIVVRPGVIILPANCLGLITHHLCTQRQAEKIKLELPQQDRNEHLRNKTLSIKHFSWVNRQLYHYYHSDTMVKDMSKKIATADNESDLYIAGYFHAGHIRAKVLDLMHKANNRDEVFSPEDLQDPWYLNATFRGGIDDSRKFPFCFQTLLIVATWCGDAKKVEALINAGADYQSQKLIALLAHKELTWFHAQGGNLEILKLLLAKNGDPDDRYDLTSPTLLQHAAAWGDKKFARLLLFYGANPWKAFINEGDAKRGDDVSDISLLYMHDTQDKSEKYNAFTLEQDAPKGWLKTMYDEVQKEKALKTILSPTDQSAEK